MNRLPILALPMKAEQENGSDTEPEDQAEDSGTEPEDQASPVPESNQPKKLKGDFDPNFNTPANPAVHKFTGTHSIQQEDQPTPDPEPASPSPSKDVIVQQLFKAEE